MFLFHSAFMEKKAVRTVTWDNSVFATCRFFICYHLSYSLILMATGYFETENYFASMFLSVQTVFIAQNNQESVLIGLWNYFTSKLLGANWVLFAQNNLESTNFDSLIKEYSLSCFVETQVVISMLCFNASFWSFYQSISLNHLLTSFMCCTKFIKALWQWCLSDICYTPVPQQVGHSVIYNYSVDSQEPIFCLHTCGWWVLFPVK